MNHSLAEMYDDLPEPARSEIFRRIKYFWPAYAREEQLVPDHIGTHAILLGRMEGKTRAGAEWIRGKANTPGLTFLLVGSSMAQAVAMARTVVGIHPPMYAPALTPDGLVWSNGTRALLRSADDHESIRGLNSDYSWVDEVSRIADMPQTWTNVVAATRKGPSPMVLLTNNLDSSWLVQTLLTKHKNGNPYVSISRKSE